MKTYTIIYESYKLNRSRVVCFEKDNIAKIVNEIIDDMWKADDYTCDLYVHNEKKSKVYRNGDLRELCFEVLYTTKHR